MMAEDRGYLFDPLRRKEVKATPEEQVRQWFVQLLLREAGVPAHLMMSEVGFRWGGKRYRADVLAYDRQGRPLAVVECKRPDVALESAVAEQAMRYNSVLDVRWIFLTNGTRTLVFKREGDRFAPFGALPRYEEML